jgi:hypothetical protein
MRKRSLALPRRTASRAEVEVVSCDGGGTDLEAGITVVAAPADTIVIKMKRRHAPV